MRTKAILIIASIATLALTGCLLQDLFRPDPAPEPGATTQKATDGSSGDKTPPESDEPPKKAPSAVETGEGGITGFLDGLGGLAVTLLGGGAAGAAYRTFRPAKRIKNALARMTEIATELVANTEAAKKDMAAVTVKEPGRNGKILDMRAKLVAVYTEQSNATKIFVADTKAALRAPPKT